MADQNYNAVMVAGVAADGTGTSNATPPLRGVLWGFHITYNSGLAAGTDVTIQAQLASGTWATLLTISNNKTSGFYPLQFASVKPDGVASGAFAHYVLTDERLRFTVAGGGTQAIADAVTVIAKIA